MTFWLHRFRKLDVTQKTHRKMLIDTFVNAIFLYDDKMLLTFNFKDGTKTITFEDVKEAANSAASGSDLDCSAAPEKSTPRGAFFNFSLCVFQFLLFIFSVFAMLFSIFTVVFYRSHSPRTTAPAATSPAAEGTKDTLPGSCFLPPSSMISSGVRGGSVE